MIGGGMGAVCRYSISALAAKYLGTRFPWGTLIANLAGCFMIGIIFALLDRTRFLSPLMRLFFMTGFLGALTTFSTYALEVVQAARAGADTSAFLNFALHNIGGVFFVICGMWMTQLILNVSE